MAIRINVGCGQSPTPGWMNLDNSPSLRLSKIPALPQLLHALGIIGAAQYEFICFARKHKIDHADATRRIPVGDGAVDVLYSSHMLEHLDRRDAENFLREVFRVLRPGGIFRVVVPDIRIHVERYKESGDADAFIESTLLCVPRPRSVAQRLQRMLVGARNHQWMYDGRSLSRLLLKIGFVEVQAMPAGQTRIRAHEPLNLSERSSESVYVEAEKPGDSPPTC